MGAGGGSDTKETKIRWQSHTGGLQLHPGGSREPEMATDGGSAHVGWEHWECEPEQPSALQGVAGGGP